MRVFYLKKDHMAALLQEMVNTSEAEPVLVVETEPGYWNRGHYYEGTKSYIDPTKVWGLPVGTKLYTAPQPTRLSDDRILSIGKRFLDRGYYPFEGLQPWVYSFARAIEREILGE